MFGRDNRTKAAMAFAVKEKSSTMNKGSCRYCGRYEDEESRCYEIIGYPPSWGTHGKVHGGRSGWGGRGGRIAGWGGCRAEREAAHAAAVQVEQQTGGHDTASDTAQVNIPGLSTEQV